jgi:hypothetical protein
MEHLTNVEHIKEVNQIRKELIEEDPSLKIIFDHPLNATEITPELLESPEFLAIQCLVYDGEPEAVAKNFLKHGIESFEESKDLEGDKAKYKLLDAIYCL